MPGTEREGVEEVRRGSAITVKKSNNPQRNLLSASGVAIFEVKREIRRSIAGKRIAMQEARPRRSRSDKKLGPAVADRADRGRSLRAR